MGKAPHIIMAEAILKRAVLGALCDGRAEQGDEFYFSSAYIERATGIGNELVRALPEPLDTSLPSIEEIEAELALGLEKEEREE